MKSMAKKIAISIIIITLVIGLFIASNFSSSDVVGYQTGLEFFRTNLKMLTEQSTDVTDVANETMQTLSNPENGISTTAANRAPTITFNDWGTEALVNSHVDVTATDPDGDKIKTITWDWYYFSTGKEEVWTFTYNPIKSSTETHSIPTPSEPGLYVLRAFAGDEYGNIPSSWSAMPYIIVDKYSDKADTTIPYFDFSTIPLSRTYLETGYKFDVTARDPESGIYFIASNWRKQGTPEPTADDYKIEILPKNGTIHVTAPTEPGDYIFTVYAKNGAVNPADGQPYATLAYYSYLCVRA